MLEEYYNIDQCTGISLFIARTGEIRLASCSVIKKKNKLEISKKVTGLFNLKQLPEYVPAKGITALNITGKGVLHKRTDKFEELTAEQFRQLLPNGDLKEFFIQHFSSGPYSYVSMIRKNDANKWLQDLAGLGMQPVMLSLGPFPVSSILKQLNFYGGDLVFEGHKITRDEEDNWIDYQYADGARSPYPIKAELEALDEALLIPYAAAFQVVLQNRLDVVKAAAEITDKNFIQLIEKRKLKLYGVLLLGFFLVILSCNALLFSSLFAENNELESSVITSQQSVADRSGMDSQIQKKENLLKQFGWDKGINKALLIDKLASVLPAEIVLDEIAVNPIDVVASRREKNLQFMDGRLLVNGTSPGILAVNEWVARLKIMPWIKSCTVQSFTIDREKNIGRFTLIVAF